MRLSILVLVAIGYFQSVWGIELPSLASTKKPRVSKFTTKPTIPTTAPSTSSLYRLNATNGATCILIRTDGLLSIKYRDKFKEDREANIFLPDDVALSGDCSESDTSYINIGFSGFEVAIKFKKTFGGERYYIDNVDLAYSTDNSHFEHIDRPGLHVKLSTPQNTILFPSPVGKSYTCDQENVITMYAQGQNDMSGHLAKLYLRDLRMQSFMYKEASTWGPSFQCSASGSYRDETAPVAVGSTLAVVVLATITGYGIWRYFKVKKVQYGTME